MQQLRPAGKAFAVHLYAGYTGLGGPSAAAQVGSQIAQYEAAGIDVELVLTYRPADGGGLTDPVTFAGFAADAVHALGSNPHFVSLQVTNEANLSGAPNASDGYYKGAEAALISGVIAAHAAVVLTGDRQVQIGFNWAYSTDAGESAFWSYLKSHGGPAFTAALNWVGLDVYPGTWGPQLTGGLSAGTTSAVNQSLSALRSGMTSAGIATTVPLHVSENGYPTGPGRTEAMQVTSMRAAITAIVAARKTYDITGYRWFDLRDAQTDSGNFETGYGLMTDTYTPKLAFSVYKQLVAQYS